MGSQAQDQQQGSQGLASIYELAKMAYLCNDWGSEAPMRSSELSDEALLACCKAGTAAGLKQPSRGPVRTDSVDLRSISSVSVRVKPLTCEQHWMVYPIVADMGTELLRPIASVEGIADAPLAGTRA